MIRCIEATAHHILIHLPDSLSGDPKGYARVPLVHGDTGRDTPTRLVWESTLVEDGCLVFPRRVEDYDLLICRFTVTVDGHPLEGARYVTDLSADASAGHKDLPVKGKPVGTWVTCSDEDMDFYGFGGMMTEINSTWIQTVSPAPEDIPHRWNGKTYYFVRSIMETYDRLMEPCIKRGVPCLVRLINRFSYRLRGSDGALRAVIGHPAYEDTGFVEQMSAFNLRTEEGLDMYCACVDFLCARYADPASPLFCAVIMDVGNEINAQAMWHNAGPMTCKAFMEEYTQQLRLAHLIGLTHNAAHRVNVSLDHYFAVPYLPADPLRCYSGRECLAYLAAIGRRDGDFPWGVSYHPYPENLLHPDFYNDQTALPTLDTPRITMKNAELWQYLAVHPALTYRGKARRVLFDEQGFHTDEADPESENKGAYAFMLLWEKMKRCPAIEQFLINRYTDMPLGDEGGLHLGLRYEEGYADDEHLIIHPGPYKKISYAIRDLGTEAEARWLAEAREYVGPALFDSLLTLPPPPPTTYFDDVAGRVGV